MQSNIVTKDATILALKQAINECSSVTIPPTQPPMVIVVPSSDEIGQHRGEVAKVGLKLYSGIYQNFQILEKFLGHRVWHQKLCLLTKFEPMGPFQSREIASDISKFETGRSTLEN